MGSLVVYLGNAQETVEPGECERICFNCGGPFQTLESGYE